MGCGENNQEAAALVSHRTIVMNVKQLENNWSVVLAQE
jgi:hypothetical protein